ncbi:MAG: hypothetical protein IJI45_08585 [Anaerolineaceae bacterium]|nr:hypothetical protein [Anaerolineaceae bacterium]
MPYMKIDLFSKALGRHSPVYVFLPEKGTGRMNAEGKLPVIWFLHGASWDNTIWQRFTKIEDYLKKAGIAAVFPLCENSFYTNIDTGRYFDYITKELPEVLGKNFPFSDKREDNFVAGMSMGGFGAMKVGFNYPEKYSAIGLFAMGDCVHMEFPLVPGGLREPLNIARILIWGTLDIEETQGTEHDMHKLAREIVESGRPMPRIYATCGRQDPCYDGTITMARDLQRMGYECTFTDANGLHDFEYWDPWLNVFIQWLLPVRD